MTEAVRALGAEIASYRAWADASGIPIERQSGEWASLYPDWHRIYTAFDTFITVSSWPEWDDATTALLVYAIARDDENSHLIKSLARKPDDFLHLAEYAVTSPERDARWQLTARLACLDADRPRVEKLLLRYVHDDEEYVRRITLMSLADIGASHLEELAVAAWNVSEAWDTESEYQRMAVLYTLNKIGSPQLGMYLALAEADGRQHLAEYAARMRNGHPKA